MPTMQENREQRATIWNQMVDLYRDDMSGEDTAKYDKLEKDLDELERSIARAEAHTVRKEANSKVDRRGVVAPEGDSEESAEEIAKGYNNAFDQYMRRGISGLSGEDQSILNKGFIEAPRGAAGTGTGQAGGYTVPPAFRQKLIEQVTYVAMMRQLAEVIVTDTGAKLPWPTVDDTDNEGTIVGENVQNTEQDVEFGTANLDAYMYSSRIVRVSFQLLNDTAFGLEGWLARALGGRIGRIQNRHFTVGTGVDQPDGIMTSADVGAIASSVNTVTYDNLVDLTESLDAAYLTPDCGWAMAQGTRKVLRKLKDGQNRPLWEPSLQAGTPDTLMGYPLKLNNFAATPAASARSIGFGDVRQAYVIRDVSDFALLRLAERYADYFQIGFVGFQRSDGTMQNKSAFKVLEHPAGG